MRVDMENLIVVSQLPVIDENLRAMANSIDEKTSVAKSLVCTEGTIKEVKAVRAELNNEFKEIEEQRKAVKKAVLEPYNKFEAAYKECISEKFKQADNDLKSKISDVESELKRTKENEVIKYFDGYKFISELDWLKYADSEMNVTLSASTKKLKEEAKAFVDKVKNDVSIIEVQEYSNEILYEYKKSLDLAYSIKTVVDRKKETEPVKCDKKIPVIKDEPIRDIFDFVENITFTLTIGIDEADNLRTLLRKGGYGWKEI